MKYVVLGAILLCLPAGDPSAQTTGTVPAVVPDSVSIDTLPVAGASENAAVPSDVSEEPPSTVPSPWLFVAGAVVVLFLLLAALRRRGRKINLDAGLLITSGEQSGTRFCIEKPKTSIGSHGDNDLVLTDDHVARHHLLLSYEHGFFFVADLNSLYGTFVAGKRIERTELAPNDKINLGGSVDLELVIGSQA